MDISLRYPVNELSYFTGTKNLIVFTIVLAVVCLLPLFWLEKKDVNEDKLSIHQIEEKFYSVQGNSFLALSNPNEPEPKTVKKIKMVVTAYSSSTLQTDSTPYITASNTWVRDGIVANNLLAFGTKVKIPELYGDKIFIVEDRMHSRKGYYHLDIWFPNYWQAKNFGATNAYIEVLEG